MNIASLFATLGFKADSSPLDKVSEKLEGIKSRLEFLGAAEVVRGIYELTERYSHFSEELGTAATAAGLTVESLQKIQYAAGLAGVSSDEVAGGLTRITRALYEARQGNEQSIQLFQRAGISMQQINSFKTGKDALLAFSDSLKGMSDSVTKQALVVDLLGRGSRNMVEFLSGGSEEIEKFGANAEAAGAVISTKSITALREMEDALSSMWRVFKTFAATIAADVAPAIRDLANVFAAFYATNQNILHLTLKDWIQKAVNAFAFLAGVMTGLAENFIDFVNDHPKLWDAISTTLLVLGGLAIVLGGTGKIITLAKDAWELMKISLSTGKDVWNFVFSNLGKLKDAIGWILIRLGYALAETFPRLGAAIFGLGEAILATPIGWAIAGITALVIAAQAAYEVFYKGRAFKDTWLGQLLEKAKGAGKSILSMLGFGGEDAPSASGSGGGGFQMPGALTTRTGTQAFDDILAKIDSANNATQHVITQANAASPGAPGYGVMAAAGVVSKGNNDVKLTNNINITVPPGASADDIASKVKKVVEDMHATNMRSTRAALAGSQVQ